MTQLQAARRIGQILNRHPAVGFALGVHAHGHWEFACDGYADLDAGSPITERTVFRIASVTKTMTAIAVMQLAERGLIELDAPASDYLRAYPLVLRSKGIRQPTIRHLLTHTSGIPDARHLTDLLHFSWGPWDGRPPIFSVPYGAPLPSLARHYRNGLEVVADPGTAFAYSNPGFATLGQIVEDVSGLPLDRYLRERVFEPLGLADTDLRRNPRLSARLATGYTFHRRGPGPVPDREWIGAGGGGAYSTLWDLAAYADALLGGGANGHGRVLESETLAQMFERQYQASPTLGAVGLAFFRTDVDGHPILSHDGILPGFNTHLAVAPDDGVAVIALTNGSAGAMRWLPAEMDALLREVVGVGAQDPPRDVPHRPEVWGQLCGRYGLPAPGDLRGRLAMAGGLEVFISGGRPMLRLRLPVPALRRGLPLQPVDRDDPRAFRLDLSPFGLGAVQLRFRQDPETGRRLMHTDLGGQPITLVERRSSRRPRAAIERLGFEDRLMLRMSRAWPQDIGALAILDGATLFDQAGEFGLDAVRSAVEARLHLVPRLRQRIRIPRRGRGGPYWTDAPAFDLARHVRELRLEPPASETQLLQAVEALRSQRFERRHPLWGMWFLTGLPDGQVAMFVKLHHTIGDGLAAMTILSTFLDSEPSGPSTAPAPWHARPAPSPSELVADTIRRRLASLGHGLALLARPGRVVRDLWAAWPAVRELLADQPGDRTSVDRIVGQGRRLALARTSYRTVRRVGRANGASVNDVLLAATAAGIRRLLLSRGEPADGVTVRAYVPVSLRRRLRGPQQGNEIGQMAVPLELGAATPLGRLRRIAGETHARKARRRPNLGSLVRGRMVSWLLLRLIIAQRVNVTTASIPGPRRQAFFASAPVLAVYPVLPLVGNQPIGVGAVSYAGKLGFGIAVDRDAVPDIDVLAAGLQDELEALGADGGAAPREPGATVLQGLRR
ncbi:MAG TPA: wax ester/triacylglycerol synthase family O-acyltransferase [Candidatus Limnocylindria bacterium]|nr:wax ester/triacylglycerol synthase family O-acyltransferase [Candidatus Limnocylindria bacterium]